MPVITVKKQVNDDNCVFCLILAIYNIVSSMDWISVPSHRQGSIIMPAYSYSIMLWGSNSTRMTATTLSFTLVEDFLPGVAYNDDCNRYDRRQRLLGATHPPNLAHATLRDLVFPNSDGEGGDSEEEDVGDDDNKDYGQDMNSQQALEQEHEASNLVEDL
jgi:hypothetical protein